MICLLVYHINRRVGGWKMFDYHMHSTFSADCDTPMEETILSAIGKGVKEICFTEHIDYEYPDDSIVFDLDIPAYTKQLNSLQDKYKDKIVIKKGVEIGVQPHLLQRYQSLLNNEYFDFIICSMHTTNRQDLHSGDFFKERSPEAAYQLYYEELLTCVSNFEQYNVLGHLDLVKRYQPLESHEQFHEIIREIFKVIIPQGKGIEVNASGFGYGLGTAMPSKDILQLYAECGGQFVTLGSDAHFAKHVAYRFPEIIDQLLAVGIEYTATFTNRKPTFHTLKDIKK